MEGNNRGSSIELIHGDCMDYMRTLPDKAFDLAIVDPPYGIGVNMNAGRKKTTRAKKRENKKWDNEIPEEAYFEELMRVSKNQIVWGGNYFPLPLTQSWIFWDKVVAEDCTFSDGELAWTSFNGALRKVVIPWSGFIGADGTRIHPTQKPIKLYRWLLDKYATPGQRILDTHLGSGSSAIAAHQMGFDFVGIELDQDYYDAACKRFKEQTAQLTLL